MVRPRSLELVLEGLPVEATIDGPVALRLAIYNFLRDAEIHTETIEGIECFSKILWCIVFNTREDRQNIANGRILCLNGNIFLNQTTLDMVQDQATSLYGYMATLSMRSGHGRFNRLRGRTNGHQDGHKTCEIQ